MCTFLFWMGHCGIWNRCILGFVKLVLYIIGMKIVEVYQSVLKTLVGIKSRYIWPFMVLFASCFDQPLLPCVCFPVCCGLGVVVECLGESGWRKEFMSYYLFKILHSVNRIKDFLDKTNKMIYMRQTGSLELVHELFQILIFWLSVSENVHIFTFLCAPAWVNPLLGQHGCKSLYLTCKMFLSLKEPTMYLLFFLSWETPWETSC